MLSKSMMMMMAQYSLLLSSTETYLKSEKFLRFHSFCIIGSMYEAKAQRSSRFDMNQSRLFTAITGESHQEKASLHVAHIKGMVAVGTRYLLQYDARDEFQLLCAALVP